jgi:hypothetical protein
MDRTQNLKRICACAVSEGIPRRSFYVAIVVGTILNIINQGDALLAHASVNWFKIMLTYLVPYAVCTYGAVSIQLKPGTTGSCTLDSSDTASLAPK